MVAGIDIIHCRNRKKHYMAFLINERMIWHCRTHRRKGNPCLSEQALGHSPCKAETLPLEDSAKLGWIFPSLSPRKKCGNGFFFRLLCINFLHFALILHRYRSRRLSWWTPTELRYQSKKVGHGTSRGLLAWISLVSLPNIVDCYSDIQVFRHADVSELFDLLLFQLPPQHSTLAKQISASNLHEYGICFLRISFTFILSRFDFILIYCTVRCLLFIGYHCCFVVSIIVFFSIISFISLVFKYFPLRNAEIRKESYTWNSISSKRFFEKDLF